MTDADCLYWLSYGAGVNSTALLILLATGRLPQYQPWRVVFADTGNERDQTYAYVEHQVRPWLLKACGKEIEIVRPSETVLERWQRLGVTGSRIMRACTDHAKIRPMQDHITRESDGRPVARLIGIDAGEPHRARPANEGDPPKLYPLVELGLDREACMAIIKECGLCVPVKSGCWHCPFMRVNEVLTLAREHPDRMKAIGELEETAAKVHGFSLFQWGNKPVSYWLDRAVQPVTAPLWEEELEEGPCDCFR